MNQAGRIRVFPSSLGCLEDSVLSSLGTWVWVAASAASIGSAAPEPRSVTPAIAASAAATQASAYGWDTYKVRLAALARFQGVREATIQTLSLIHI